MGGVNAETGRPGPAPMPARDGDKVQARQRVNVEVRAGRRPHPNELPCADCGHVWEIGERRHEYDHHLGYAAEHHLDVEPVCTTCHAVRDARTDACFRGHLWTESNTLIRADGQRTCRACRRERERAIRTAEWWRARRARKAG